MDILSGVFRVKGSPKKLFLCIILCTFTRLLVPTLRVGTIGFDALRRDRTRNVRLVVPTQNVGTRRREHRAIRFDSAQRVGIAF